MTTLPSYGQPIEIQTNSHTSESKEIITKAMLNSLNESAVIIGCGRCGEIPLRELVDGFQKVDLVDIDVDALQYVKEETQKWNSENILNFYNDDITGAISKVEMEAQQIVSKNSNPMICLRQLGDLLRTTKYNFWVSPENENYDLVICSMVLTQLQAIVRERVEKIFISRFSQCLDALTSDAIWCKALWNFARGLEDAFINHLNELVKPEGKIYLSATVHVSWLMQNDESTLVTDGSWITIKTSKLEDYLNPRSNVIERRNWNWVRQEKEGEYWGRLYGIQALIYQQIEL